MKLSPVDFFNLDNNPLADIFKDCEYVWDGLKKIKPYIKERLNPNIPKITKSNPVLDKTLVILKGKTIDSGFEIVPSKTIKNSFDVIISGSVLEGASIIFAGAVLFDETISIGENTIIEPGALIKGPTIIGNKTEIRQGAYIRGNAVIGDACIVGHTTEIKSSIMLGESKAGHFAYIGDSILGKVNLGAGTKLANLKIVKSGVTLLIEGRKYDTGLRKFGAILGDNVETGCNSVTMPGTIIGRDSVIYPNTTVRGYCPECSVVKLKQNQEIIKKRT